MDLHCQECQAAFEKDGIPFKPSMCKYCQHGRKLHEKGIEESDAEKAWDKCDWNSCKFKGFYHG